MAGVCGSEWAWSESVEVNGRGLRTNLVKVYVGQRGMDKVCGN